MLVIKVSNINLSFIFKHRQTKFSVEFHIEIQIYRLENLASVLTCWEYYSESSTNRNNRIEWLRETNKKKNAANISFKDHTHHNTTRSYAHNRSTNSEVVNKHDEWRVWKKKKCHANCSLNTDMTLLLLLYYYIHNYPVQQQQNT